MTDDAQTHRDQVNEAIGHVEMVAAAIAAYSEGVTDAIAKVTEALDALAEQAATAATAADNALAFTEKTKQTGEDYLESTARAGDGTIVLARASKDASELADATLRGVHDLISTVNGAVANTKDEATKMVLVCGSTVETITEGISATTGHLTEAKTNVEQAINIVP